MIKSKLVRSIIISIPLLTTNCFGIVKTPKYIERNESPTTKTRQINAKNNKNMSEGYCTHKINVIYLIYDMSVVATTHVQIIE